MNDNLTKSKNFKYYLYSSIGTILLIISLSLIVYNFNLEQRAINISATIKSIDYNTKKRNSTIEYKVEDKTYTKIISLKDNEKLTVTDKVIIRYDKNNPNKLINTEYIILTIFFLIVSSIISLLIGLNKTIKLLKNKKNINYLKKDGLFIECLITELIINNTIKQYKGKYPYKLRCKYLNPKDNKEYIFESDNTYINLQEIINQYNKRSIIVYIDKNNTSNYHVDLKSLFPKIEIINPKELMKSKTIAVTSNEEGKDTIENENNKKEE